MLNGSMKLWTGIFDKLDRGTMLKDLCALGMRAGPGLGVVVRRTSFQTKFQPAWFRASVVLNYSCYVVLGLNRPRR